MNFLTIVITQTFSNLLHSSMEVKLTATLLVAPNRQCDPLVACSATSVWDLAYRNLKVFCLERKFVLAM